MAFHVDVKINLSPRQKRVMRGAVIVGTVIAALGVGVVVAAPKHTFKAGDPVVATSMNENFADLDGRIAAAKFVGSGGPKAGAYSVGFTLFKGRTSTGGPTSDGTYTGAQIGGYYGAKTKCEAELNSPSAHMCTSDELIRSEQLGVIIASTIGEDGWYAAATGGVNYVTPLAYSTDCGHWSSDASTADGTRWRNGSSPCNVPSHILCCD